jgi:hypothetical protein
MIITLKGADFSQSNIGTLDSWFIAWSGSGLTAASSNAKSIKKDGTSTTTLTYTYNTENYEYVSGTVKDATGATVGSIVNASGTITVTINAGNTIKGKITITISMNYIGVGEEPEPEIPGGGGGSGETPDSGDITNPSEDTMAKHLGYSINANDGELQQTNAQLTFKVVSDYVEIPTGAHISEFYAIADP